MKKFLKLSLIGCLISAMLLGCGSSDMPEAYNTSESVAVMEEAAEDMEMESAASGTELSTVEVKNRKLIRNISMSLQTKAFDELIDNIQTRVSELGGYIESSSISGARYENIERNRYSYLTVRIPSEKLDEFVGEVKEVSNVTNISEYVDDVTLQYVDTESHITALETEQKRLLELLEQAENVEDIITIEGRLSTVRYELESYASQLRTLDNQVEYSKVEININEVERETNVKELGFWGEVTEKFSDSIYHLTRDLREIAVWFLGSLPYLVVWAAVIGAVIFGIRAVRKKKALKKLLADQGPEVTDVLKEETEES